MLLAFDFRQQPSPTMAEVRAFVMKVVPTIEQTVFLSYARSQVAASTVCWTMRSVIGPFAPLQRSWFLVAPLLWCLAVNCCQISDSGVHMCCSISVPPNAVEDAEQYFP